MVCAADNASLQPKVKRNHAYWGFVHEILRKCQFRAAQREKKKDENYRNSRWYLSGQ